MEISRPFSSTRSARPPAGLQLYPRRKDPLEEVDWRSWLRSVERKRRLLGRSAGARRTAYPLSFLAACTHASFRLDGLSITDSDMAAALARGAAGHPFRSRQGQRIRNHVSILLQIESALRTGEPLRNSTFVRWYTSISCGLSTAGIDDSSMLRIDDVIRRISSPQLRLQPAIIEIARLHTQLLADPIAPSFNGILARLLLRYHLGRCGLPAIRFDATADTPVLSAEARFLPILLKRIDEGYDRLLAPVPDA